MTPPMTPREKVAAFLKERDEACGVIDADDAERDESAELILTALASGSGDHAELARLAEAATPGPWSAADWGDDFGENKLAVQATEPEVLSPGQSSIWPDGIRCLRVAETMDGERPAEDAAFIAAANPATVLALLAENAALRGGVQSLEIRRDFYKHNMKRAEVRATEAERKLAEAVGHLTAMTHVAPRAHEVTEALAFIPSLEDHR